MTKIGELVQVNKLTGLEEKRLINNKNDQKESSSVNFADTIKDFLSAVNNSQKEAAEKVADIIQGKSENLAEAMTSLEKSQLSFQLMLEIRNKLLESYNEIKRMPV